MSAAGFDEVWTVVDGAVDQEWVVRSPREFDEVAASIEAWADDADVPVGLFALRHWHEPEVGECECAQFASSHLALREWGVAS